MNYFQLTKGVYVTNNEPIDGDRYIANSISDRDSIITSERAYTGLQVYVSGGTANEIGLYTLVTLVEWDIASSIWEKINSGEIDQLIEGSGITLDTSVPNEIIIQNSKYVTDFNINLNILKLKLKDTSEYNIDLSYLVDTDTYVCGGTYDAATGTITFEVGGTSGGTFDVTGFLTTLAMEDLSNVSATTAAANEILVYNGTNWVNSAQTITNAKDYLDPGITSENSVGGIAENDIFDSGTTFQEMWENLLMSPEVDPTKTNKSLSTVIGSSTSWQEVGSTYVASITYNFNDGQIVCSNSSSTSIDLVGAENGHQWTYPDTTTGDTVVSRNTIMTYNYNSWVISLKHDAGVGDYYTSRNNISNIYDSFRNAVTSFGAWTSTRSILAYYYLYARAESTQGPTISGLTGAAGTTGELRNFTTVSYLNNTSTNSKRLLKTYQPGTSTHTTFDLIIPGNGQTYFTIYLPKTGSGVDVTDIIAWNIDTSDVVLCTSPANDVGTKTEVEIIDGNNNIAYYTQYEYDLGNVSAQMIVRLNIGKYSK